MWESSKEYEIKAKARDIHNSESKCLDILYVTIDENPPLKKPIIDGPNRGKAGTSYNYKFFTNDTDGDDVYYWIE
jgi:hypothetical protein